MKNLAPILTLIITLVSCSPEKSPIEYGFDKCYYCKMTIVDKKFGGELVTRKGKVYKFDATECLVNFLHSDEIRIDEVSMMLTNTYDNPGELVQVEHCYYLRSENMPSPMGMYINPFREKTLALEYQSERNGNIYHWHEVRRKVPEGFQNDAN